MNQKFKVFSHTADVGLAVRGKTLPKLFENAALGMISLLFDSKKIKPKEAAPIAVRSVSWESLLVDWLDEVLFQITVKHWGFCQFKVERLKPFELKAAGFGEKLDRKEKTLAREIKAVTYHDLKIKKGKSGYSARIVLDI